MASVVEIVIVVPTDTVAGVVVNQNRAGTLIVRWCGIDSQTLECAKHARSSTSTGRTGQSQAHAASRYRTKS